MDSFYTKKELEHLGFKSIGNNIFLSKKASFYNPEKISIGNNVRIDDFVIISGYVTIGNFVHIATGSVVMAKKEGIFIEDFAGISIQCKILGSSDDFSGNGLIGPCVPEKYRQISSKTIRLQKHSLLGCNSIILPGGNLAEGVSVGVFSLINRPTKEWGIYFGIPAKRILERSKNILQLEEELLKSKKSQWGGGHNKLKPHKASLSFSIHTSSILLQCA
ncbi:hypothetical protein [Helicobacter sp. 13S00477-4]|uniref:acyltransferase n=1 Tax=Helicobacter sp. 13S00477-4 TaxID=1905759 RepID=UPI000BA5CEB1|nr:hypothetical protein [Helicobacter sp. 13S00477-4]PAF51517.1 hypothetical protein BKH44_05595 [Helicobacter sp. 13S00477-4]